MEIMLSAGVLGKKALSSEAQEWAYDFDLTNLSILHWSSSLVWEMGDQGNW